MNQQPANDKLHSVESDETRNHRELKYDKDKESFELDVPSEEEDYDHPLPYETSAEDGSDFNSDYDEQNPYLGDEYAKRDEIAENDLEELGMHVDNGESVELSSEDELLARTPEDDRDDLDEEGYPVNDAEVKP
ncbi:hypothetical protein C7T94_16480 [Pedobacter yulinensis]|uniref:Uncharacterized protein n=2 Tax=Pedobacter yulinensis TaxID=2126353 RepID=A0A2T3HJ93_9SPHI|nr:hypothetical protein C7T94_16480 [Pedobacter yulinensis]